MQLPYLLTFTLHNTKKDIAVVIKSLKLIFRMKKSSFLTVFIAIAITMGFALTGCYERRYYHEHRHHSPEFNDRHPGYIER